jgi:hypothetical protein
VAIGNANTLLALVVPRERRIRVLATLVELHEKGRINYLHVENICNIRLMSNLDRSAHGKGQSCYNKIRLTQAPCAGLLNISLALFDLRKLKYSELDSGTLTEHSCIVCLQSHFSMHPIPTRCHQTWSMFSLLSSSFTLFCSLSHEQQPRGGELSFCRVCLPF